MRPATLLDEAESQSDFSLSAIEQRDCVAYGPPRGANRDPLRVHAHSTTYVCLSMTLRDPQRARKAPKTTHIALLCLQDGAGASGRRCAPFAPPRATLPHVGRGYASPNCAESDEGAGKRRSARLMAASRFSEADANADACKRACARLSGALWARSALIGPHRPQRAASPHPAARTARHDGQRGSPLARLDAFAAWHIFQGCVSWTYDAHHRSQGWANSTQRNHNPKLYPWLCEGVWTARRTSRASPASASTCAPQRSSTARSRAASACRAVAGRRKRSPASMARAGSAGGGWFEQCFRNCLYKALE